jgi:hypothetical protein
MVYETKLYRREIRLKDLDQRNKDFLNHEGAIQNFENVRYEMYWENMEDSILIDHVNWKCLLCNEFVCLDEFCYECEYWDENGCTFNEICKDCHKNVPDCRFDYFHMIGGFDFALDISRELYRFNKLL